MARSTPRQIFSRSGWSCGIGSLIALILFVVPSCWAQLPPPSNTTSTPYQGAGHDYIHAPLETVNPANGSVSIRIPIRMPAGRGLTIPFSFAYDSNGTDYLTTTTGHGLTGLRFGSTGSIFSSGGWSDSVPLMSVSGGPQYTMKVVNGGVVVGSQSCGALVNYVFQDERGNRHDLGLSVVGALNDGTDAGGNCLTAPEAQSAGIGGNSTQGGEDSILATTTAPSPSGVGLLILTDVPVTFGDGTVYNFMSPIQTPVPGETVTWMPSTITDRNGNRITLKQGTTTTGGFVTANYVDTVDRTVLSDSGFGQSPETITVGGLTSPYAVTWTTVQSSFSTTLTNLYTGPNASCPNPLHGAGGGKVISSITLPNGQEFAFSYDSVYGNVSRITYPSGGYVRYVWGLNTQSEASVFHGLVTCEPRYDTPAITDRYVSYDGTHEVLHQSFQYLTTWDSTNPFQWDSKQTTVTTTDLVRNTSFQTGYKYLPSFTSPDPNTGVSTVDSRQEIPVENTITYFDTNGTLLKTVTKVWDSPRSLAAEQVTLPNGQSSLTVFCYDGNAELIEKDEYDLGNGTPSPTSCANGDPRVSPLKAGNMVRKTLTAYATFTGTGTHIVDRPSSGKVYDGAGNEVAETDTSYDQSSLQPTSSLVQHTTPAGGSVRGNPTTITKCLVVSSACASGSPATTNTYYDTGQVYQSKDPKGNVTTFSYTDSDSSCGGSAPPSGASNAYLTQVTYPATNGISHIVSYCYDYLTDLRLSSTDENNQVTSYKYNDSLDRPTETDSPDGGQTTISYNDAAPTPSITVNKKLDTSGRLFTTTTVMDGLGLATQTELTSDPEGTDITNTTYDGLGRVYLATNPYRTTSDPTYGTTTFVYDALGRTTSVTHPDGSKVTTQYTNAATEVTDEGNGTKSVQRISQVDGLGRMVSVCEVTGAAQLGGSGTPAACNQDISATGFLTSYTYDTLGNLIGVAQNGLNNRSFAYNSLSQLTSATNPESGTTTYTYDLDGNIITKKDARGVTTCFGDWNGTSCNGSTGYDALNRVLKKTFSGGTPPANYTYDVSNAGGQSETYPVGRLVAETTGSPVATRSLFSYDQMGRVVNNWQCTPTNCGGTPYALTYVYDLAGDITSYTNGAGVTFTQTIDTAAQLTSLVSSFTDANHPGTLLSSVEYNALGSTVSDSLGNGVTEVRSYTNRGQLSSLAAAAGATLAKATATFKIGGSEQSLMQNCPGGGGNTATVGTAGTGSGTNASSPPPPCTTVYDTGTVSITVGPSNSPFTTTASYGQFDTATTIAAFLARALNTTPGSPVTATSSGGTITLTSVLAGPDGDYPLSGNSQTNDPTDFSNPSFFAGASGTLGGGGSLTGGTTVYTLNMTSYAPNGNILGVTDSVNGVWTYSYDDFNRLIGSSCTSHCPDGQNTQGFSYAYDRLGNRWNQSLTAGSGGTSSLSFSGSNNRIDGTSYDAVGNVLNDGVHSYIYDAESQVVQVDSGNTAKYVYDAMGERVQKTVGSTVTNYIYDLAGNAIAEVNGAGAWQRGEVYAGGRHLATYTNSTTYFNHADWLGTERARTAVSGAVCETITSLAFGDGETTTGTCGDPSTHHFDGKERDAETGNDNFGARYYSSQAGRWLSADWSSVPVPVPYANLTNPQTLNLYAMVSDDPVTFADLDGHEGAVAGTSIQGAVPLYEDNDNPNDANNVDLDPDLANATYDDPPVVPLDDQSTQAAAANNAANQNQNSTGQNQSQDQGSQNPPQNTNQSQSQNDQSTQGRIPGKLPPAANPGANAAKQKTKNPIEETKPKLKPEERPAPKMGPYEPNPEKMTTWQKVVYVITRAAEALGSLGGRFTVPVVVRPNCNMPGTPGCGGPPEA